MQVQAPNRRELGLPCPVLGEATVELPGQRRGEGALGTDFAAFPVPAIQHPELYMGVCVGVRPLSPTELGENQTLAAVLRAGSAPRISRSGFAKGTATRIACLEQTGCFFLGKPASRVLGWDWSAWAPRWPAALGGA